MRALKRNQRSAGYTLVEMAIGATVMMGLLSAVAMSTLAASRAYEEAMAQDELNRQAHRALAQITEQLADAGVAGLLPVPDPDFGTEILNFRQCTGYAAESQTWGSTVQIAFELEEGELDDGIDNNGNGVADEAVVVLVEDVGGANERRTVLTHWVREQLEGEILNGIDDNGNGLIDESGLVFSSAGSVLTIQLTLQRPGSEGGLVMRTVQTSIRLRN